MEIPQAIEFCGKYLKRRYQLNNEIREALEGASQDTERSTVSVANMPKCEKIKALYDPRTYELKPGQESNVHDTDLYPNAKRNKMSFGGKKLRRKTRSSKKSHRKSSKKQRKSRRART